MGGLSQPELEALCVQLVGDVLDTVRKAAGVAADPAHPIARRRQPRVVKVDLPAAAAVWCLSLTQQQLAQNSGGLADDARTCSRRPAARS